MLFPQGVAVAFGAATLFSHIVSAVPMDVEKRQASTVKASTSTPAGPVAAIGTILSALGGTLITGADAAAEVLTELANIVPTATPTSVPQATSMLSSIIASATAKSNSSLYEIAAQYILNGLGPTDIAAVVAGYSAGDNSPANSNTATPSKIIYPKASAQDAPYSQNEASLRQVIHIPATFTYGKVAPLILMPGTGSRGGVNFDSNFIKLFTGSSFADPVWINPPGFQLEDAQLAAEYIAYAINYISSISGNVNVSVLAWSQGNIDTQWAYKYWPSTRKIVSDHIAISPDYHGTILAELICPNGFPCSPSIYQQEANANFIRTLNTDDGDSAYVPTTTLYSGVYDEIVEPQQGTGASAFLKDVRGVGVTNNEAQTVCSGYLLGAGGFNTHESMLANSLSYYLAVDALTNPGPGDINRLNKDMVCGSLLPPGLTLTDLLATESTIPIAAVLLLLGPAGFVTSEPPIRSYAA